MTPHVSYKSQSLHETDIVHLFIIDLGLLINDGHAKDRRNCKWFCRVEAVYP